MNKDIIKLYTEIEKNTGEIVFSKELADKEYKDKYIDRTRNVDPSVINYLNKKEEMKWFNQELGGFVLMQYVKNELLFNELSLEIQTLARIIYLSTFIDFQDRNGNVLMKKGTNNRLYPIKRRDLQYLLNIKDTAFKQFLKETKEKELLYVNENDEYVLSDKYFKKGKSKFSKKGYTRLYIDTIRSLYENTSPSQHRTLGYVFKLLPKTHYETNQICHNPEAYNPNPMNFKEIAEYVGYGVNTKQNISSFKKSLYNLYIDYDDRRYNVFKGIIIDNMGKDNQTFFVVNPMITYGGNDFKIMDGIIAKMFFRSKEKSI